MHGGYWAVPQLARALPTGNNSPAKTGNNSPAKVSAINTPSVAQINWCEQELVRHPAEQQSLELSEHNSIGSSINFQREKSENRAEELRSSRSPEVYTPAALP